MSGLNREVVKWLQSLDLTWQIKTPKWDLTNGYLIAEIFSWYFPQGIQMHMYYDSTSLEPKMKNWNLLKNFFKRHRIDISSDYITGTIHCKEGASNLLIERVYEILTNRQIKKVVHESVNLEFSDEAYQEKLPLHARSTASKSIKNNLRITEIMADQNLILNSQKAQKIINDHLEHRRDERMKNPGRFHVRATAGELSIRRPAPQNIQSENTDYQEEDSDTFVHVEYDDVNTGDMTREASVQFKEVDVKQVDKSAFYNLPVHGY